MCCGIIYKGRYGEVIIDPHLYKPCCQRKPDLLQPQEEAEEMDEEEEEEEDEQAAGQITVSALPSPIPKQEEEKPEEGGASW